MTRSNEILLHGHRVSYREGGSGPVLVLVHGITSSSRNWEPVLPLLEEHFTVIAPDLLGHGESAKPVGDYSLGAYACLVRDLMLTLGHDRATVVGHSLGGGEAVARAFGRLGFRAGADLGEMARGFASLSDLDARQAFVHTARAVIDTGGQRVDATDRLYLAEAVPTLLAWGDRDPIIPATHGIRAQKLMPGSRLELFEGAGHFPHLEEPFRFVRLLRDFVGSTEPARASLDRARELMLARAS